MDDPGFYLCKFLVKVDGRDTLKFLQIDAAFPTHAHPVDYQATTEMNLKKEIVSQK